MVIRGKDYIVALSCLCIFRVINLKLFAHCLHLSFPGIGLPGVAASGTIAANTIANVGDQLALMKELRDKGALQ